MKLVDNNFFKDYIKKNIFMKGSTDMFFFVVENLYVMIQAMQIIMQGLKIACNFLQL